MEVSPQTPTARRLPSTRRIRTYILMVGSSLWRLNHASCSTSEMRSDWRQYLQTL